MTVAQCADVSMAERGRQIASSGKYAKPRGRLLGRVEFWGLDVYEGSPPEWVAALVAEAGRQDRAC